MNVRRAATLAGLGLVVLAAACGRKEGPLPPLRPEPGRIADARLRRVDDRSEVHFTIPAANADNTTPAVLDRVEIYAMSTPAGVPAPTVAQILDASHLKGHVDVRHDAKTTSSAKAKPTSSAKAKPTSSAKAKPAATAKAAPAAPPDLRPAPGEAATFVDRAGTDQHGDTAPVLHYVVVGVTGRAHKGQAAGPFDVTLATAPPVPQGLVFTYDEQRLTLTWQAGGPAQQFRVYEVNAAGAVIDPGHLEALQSVATFSLPVEFDKPRCLVVRAAREVGPTVIEGAASAPLCKTPVDTFPPPAPAGLVAFALDGGVDLKWDAVDAKDLAGYVVLRGDGSGDKLLPLTKVMPDVHYTDRTVTRGATYSYAVRAEDAKGNASGLSNRQQVTVRIP